MAEWIKLDQLAIVRESIRSTSDRGVQINLALSPFDVPEAVRGFFDPGLDRFVIEFRYMQEDSWSRQKGDSDLSLRIGKHNSRLYGIEIDVKQLRASHIALAIQVPRMIGRMLGRLSAGGIPSKGGGNFDMLKSVVEQEEPELFKELMKAGA